MAMPASLEVVRTRMEELQYVSDTHLMSRIAAGDGDALAALYELHGSTLQRLATTILGDPADAEEVVADALIQVWRCAARFDPSRGTLATWLTVITRTRALDLLRSRRRRDGALDRLAAEECVLTAIRESSVAESSERLPTRLRATTLVRRSLATLPEVQRHVLELAYYRGLTQSEIADLLGQPLGTVKTRMRTGIQKLRVALGVENEEDVVAA